jgi:thymidylate synthase ThyX
MRLVMEIFSTRKVFHPLYPDVLVAEIEMVNIGASRRSVEDAKNFIADVGTLSYGNNEAKYPDKVFNTLLRLGHLSVMEFVPVPMYKEFVNIAGDRIGKRREASLPEASLRTLIDLYGEEAAWSHTHWDKDAEKEVNKNTFCFKVKTTKDIAVQIMRHRNASYLEMSRRYVKDSKVPFEFSDIVNEIGVDFKDGKEATLANICKLAYEHKLESKMTPQDARKVIPFGFFTTFFMAGYWESFWDNFLNLRCDPSTQPDTRAIALNIRDMINEQKGLH